MKRAAVASSLLGLLLAACAPRAAVESPNPPPAAPAASASPSVASASPSPPPPNSAAAGAPSAHEQPDPAVTAALTLVSKVRQLAVKRAVPGLRLDRQALRAEVDRMLLDDTPDEVVLGNTEFLYAVDAVGADFDLRHALALLMGAELAGFYDPKQRHMVLAADLSRDAQDITLYHELVHALQDQNFDLQSTLDYRPDASDVQGALHALAEGDATATMMDVFAVARGTGPAGMSPDLLRLDSLLMQASPELEQVPGIVARSVLAPYVDGLAFVQALRAHGVGSTEVDRAFREPPLSTEQVLHPAKYFAREPVVPLPLPSAATGFGSAIFHDVAGEQGLRLLFEEWAPANAATRAASDWGGDRYAVFSQGSSRLVVWPLVVDNDAAAARAEVLFAAGALRPEQPPEADARLRPFVSEAAAKSALSRAGLCQNRTQRGPFAVVRAGRHLGVTLGPYFRGDTAVRPTDNCPLALALAAKVAAER